MQTEGRGATDRVSRRALSALLGILIAGGAVRALRLGTDAYSEDEFSTLQSARGRGQMYRRIPTGVLLATAPALTRMEDAAPWPAIWTEMVDDNHPPLYYMLVRGWVELAGTGEDAARSLSVIISLLAILALFEAGRVWRGVSISLWACMLMALAAPQVRYGRELRPYALLELLALVACAALLHLERRPPTVGAAIVLGGCLYGALLTHYHALGLLAFFLVYPILSLRGRARRLAVGGTLAAALLFAASWGPMVWQQRRRVDENPWYEARGEDRVSRLAATVSGLPWQLLTQPDRSHEPGPWWPAVLYAAPLLLGWEGLVWGCWLAATVGQVAAFDLALVTEHATRIRFSLLAGAAFYLLIPALTVGRWRRWGHLLPAVAALACIGALPSVYAPVNPPWREVVACVESRTGSDSPLIVVNRRWQPGTYYVPFAHYGHAPERPLLLLSGPAGPTALAGLRRYPSAWVLTWGLSPLGLLPQSRIEERLRWGRSLTLWRVSWPSDSHSLSAGDPGVS